VAVGNELLARYTRQPADVVLVGTQRAVPTGIDAIRRCCNAPGGERHRVRRPGRRRRITAAIAGGARGYLRWDAARPTWWPRWPHVTSNAVPAPVTRSVPVSQLTERELQVCWA